jgi:uncharacterized protein YacL
MVELFLRALFLLVCASIGYQVIPYWEGWENAEQVGLIAGLVVAVAVIVVEVLLSKRPIQSISAIVFGLITGFLVALLFGKIAELVISQKFIDDGHFVGSREMLLGQVQIGLYVICSYLAILVLYKTQDRFRFIIPYVEFQKEEKGSRPILVDTSAVIDGRLMDLCDTRILDTVLIIPKFVLQELQHVADSGDRLRRNRGRRGLEMLQRLQRDDRVTVQIHDGRSARGSTVDSKLVSLAAQLQARILTCDYNLSKLAEIQNVDAVNLNDLTNALRPIVLPGEDVSLKIIRPGDEAGQGVGYMADGTMVVVEQGREKVGQTASVIVTSTLQTNAGRMVFGRVRHEGSDSSGGDKGDGKRQTHGGKKGKHSR